MDLEARFGDWEIAHEYQDFVIAPRSYYEPSRSGLVERGSNQTNEGLPSNSIGFEESDADSDCIEVDEDYLTN